MDRDGATASSPPAVVRPAHHSAVRSITILHAKGKSAAEIALELDFPIWTVRAVLESPLSRALAAQDQEP